MKPNPGFGNSKSYVNLNYKNTVYLLFPDLSILSKPCKFACGVNFNVFSLYSVGLDLLFVIISIVVIIAVIIIIIRKNFNFSIRKMHYYYYYFRCWQTLRIFIIIISSIKLQNYCLA